MRDSPKIFLKKRRPERFSDSRIISESKLNRTILESHLETLDVRKQETDFEEFARKLCSKEICPGLIPQTGSTGGGDSKADTENTPISSDLKSFVFFEGEDSQLNERLAFAFSINKKYPKKIRDDVEGIFGTGRDYKKVYFISSRAIKDKARAVLEDELTKKYGFSVIIRDRNWILDRVFENKRQSIAIEELKMGEGLEEKKDIGPIDYQKNKKLEEIELLIEKDVSARSINLKTVDNCLEAARLVAELEEPRQRIDSFFDRATRISKEYGSDEQYFSVIYNQAWITHFWLEDSESFLKQYGDVERLALSSDNIFVVERLYNLWNVLFTVMSESEDISAKKFLKEKTSNIKKKLGEFVANLKNSSAATQAEFMLCYLDFFENRATINTDDFIVKLSNIVDKAVSLIGFPFRTMFEIFNQLDIVLNGNEAFENLQEHLVLLINKREGDISMGTLLLDRGKDYLGNGEIYKAIDCLGRAVMRLYKEESRPNLMLGLYYLASAYEDAGLLWAARSALMMVASLAGNEFLKYSKIHPMQTASYRRLRVIELRLGRIGYSISWHQIHLLFARQLVTSEEESTELLDDSLYFGSLFGCLLIKTPDSFLANLEKLPDTLIDLDLDLAAYGLIYRLGGKDLLPPRFLNDIGIEKVETFFNSWLNQPAQKDLPSEPDFLIGDNLIFKSIILGCEFVLNVPNKSPEIEIAEYILASLESFLSTVIEMRAISRARSINISLLKEERTDVKLNFEINADSAIINLVVKCGNFVPNSIKPDEQKSLADDMFHIVNQAIAHTIVFENMGETLTNLFKKEEVASRAFSLTSPMVTLGNVLGNKPKRSINDWLIEDKTTYSYSPDTGGKVLEENSLEGENVSSEDKDASISSNEDVENNIHRHSEIKNISVIQHHLWDKAGWQGALYGQYEGYPPIMGLMFDNEKIARTIFEDWRATIGNPDESNVMRITVVKGVYKKTPAWYTLTIGNNLDKEKMGTHRKVIVSPRTHILTPDTTKNLDDFIKSYNQYGCFYLMPAIISSGGAEPKILTELSILKQECNFREAWQIGPQDIDRMGVSRDADPIIPDGVENAPILEVLKIRENRS